mmetsp:Transcript_85934/g.136522  ORF Transcript_85934/g.136522 Transcript_85934/m.136522 type:complete len:449 (-) Transcript_85934:1847-3193(-)
MSAAAALDGFSAARARGIRDAGSPVLGEDGAPRGHAEGQTMVAAGTADDPVVDSRSALWAGQHVPSRVPRGIPRKDAQGQIRELAPHLVGHITGGLQFDECSGTLCEEFVVVRRQSNQRVDGLGVQDVLVFSQAQRCFHRLFVLTFVQLPLGKEIDVKGLAAPPRAFQRSIAGHTLVLCHQRLQGLCSGHCALGCTCHLSIQSLVFKLFHFQRRQQVEPLDAIWMTLRTTWHILGHLVQKLCGLSVSTGFSVQLYCLNLLIFVQQVLCVLRQQAFDLLKVVLLRKIHSQLPLIQKDTRVHRSLHVSVAQKCRDGLLTEPHRGELVANLRQEWAAFRQGRDDSLQRVVVLQEVVGINQSCVVSGLGVVVGCIVPLATICVVVTDGTPGLMQQVLIGSMRQLNDSEPIAQAHPQINRQVLAIDLAVEAFCFIEALEIGSHLSLLLHPVVQ